MNTVPHLMATEMTAAQIDIQVTIQSDPQLLSAVRGMIRGYMQSKGYEGDRAEEIVLAVDEACTNAIRHAYHGEKGKPLALDILSGDNGLVFRLMDEGIPAEAGRVASREEAAPHPDTVKPGGLGLKLIRRVFDEVEFIPGPVHGNTVIMRLAPPQYHEAKERAGKAEG